LCCIHKQFSCIPRGHIVRKDNPCDGVVSQSTRKVCENVGRHETGAVVCGRVRGIVIAVGWREGAWRGRRLLFLFKKNFFNSMQMRKKAPASMKLGKSQKG